MSVIDTRLPQLLRSDVPLAGMFGGLSDLALSMGHPGDTTHPRVQDALAEVFGRAAQAGVATGVLAATPKDFARYAAMGARYLPMTITAVIAGALREAIALRKGARAGAR